jgi:hypothetical protein
MCDARAAAERLREFAIGPILRKRGDVGGVPRKERFRGRISRCCQFKDRRDISIGIVRLGVESP